MLDPHGILNDPKMHPALVRALRATVCPIEFQIIQGGRTQAQENALVAKGLSHTTHSRHVYEQNANGMCCAIDFMAIDADPKEDWVVGDANTGQYHMIGMSIVLAAAQLEIKMQWGGMPDGAWTDNVISHFQDWDHVQLDPSEYP